MHSTSLLITLCLLVAINYCAEAQQFADDGMGFDKRAAMRNALVRFGRSAPMRNALVRFGKRADVNEYGLEEKRNGAPEPFVRFGKRSSSHTENLHDLLDLLQKLDTTNNA